MGSESQYYKIYKQRITARYNREHRRTGTIWGGRFKSVLVEQNSGALRPMSVYIDLNPVRAGKVRDPKDYAYTGYGSAVRGNREAREGIIRLTDAPNWETAQAEYRQLLYAVGTKIKPGKASLSLEDFERVAREGGRLSLAQVMQCQIPQLTEGLVLGTAKFVAKHLRAFEQTNHRKRRGIPVALPSVRDWGDLSTLRGRRRRPPK
jgi:hypothetical protein